MFTEDESIHKLFANNPLVACINLASLKKAQEMYALARDRVFNETEEER